MRRFLTLALVGLFVGLGVANATGVANTTSVAKVGAFNQADMEALFGENAKSVNVIVLDEREMKETKGEAWLVALGFSAVVAGLDYLLNKEKKYKLESPILRF